VLNHTLERWQCDDSHSSKILLRELKKVVQHELGLDRFFMDKNLFRDEVDSERLRKIIEKLSLNIKS
jgi:hypothetical protein